CAKPLIEQPNENDDNCPVLGSASVGELAFTSDSVMCFQNPADPSKQCSYSANDGAVNLPPSLGESIDCDTGEPKEPDQHPKDDDNCYVTPNGRYCEEDPNDKCAVTTSSYDNTTQMQCDTNCGTVDGVFICQEESNDDQTPSDKDKNCLDDVFRLSNPTICKSNQETDKDGDGLVNNTDVVTGLNSIGSQNDSIIDNLSNLAELSKTNNTKTEETNKLLANMKDDNAESNGILSSMNSKLGAIDENVKTIADALTGTGETVEGVELTVPDRLKDNDVDWQNENFGTVTADFITKVKSAVIYSSVSNFFKVSFIQSQCPSYSFNAGAWIDGAGTMVFDHWCRPEVARVFPWVEKVIMLLFMVLAYREFRR
ncbi:hypothetical protein CJF42_25360, partial [Pseudoalteromonas sp. NBT06-2]|uniref:hypothetical protein n=1 Tax=Pseudoalteromonas sp. NBT06-2 TaxID=2025950 RepID=UPI000BC91519